VSNRTLAALELTGVHRIGLLMSPSSLVTVELRLRSPPRGGAPRPEARFFVDLDPCDTLRSEIEVALIPEPGGLFRGMFRLEPTAREQFFYRVGLCASPGSAWTLRIRSAARDQDLLDDGDTLDTAKCWLVGTCTLAAARDGRVVALDAYRSRRAARAHRRL
jgi:hypothetical protein